MAGTTRLELPTSAVTDGVGGHRLIPQGTACHFLSSPYCTQILAGLLNFSHPFQHNFREPSRPATSERDVLLRRLVRIGHHSLVGRNNTISVRLVRLWVYNPRNGILMRRGFEEPGDVQDIRLVVDTIPTLAWSADR